MIVKMIKNLENKIKLQINRLETRIDKMQEMFNKDLEEVKKLFGLETEAQRGEPPSPGLPKHISSTDVRAQAC